MNEESLKIAIEAMPAEVQSEFERMRSAKRGLFGNATTHDRRSARGGACLVPYGA
jgi:hypothetical protein